jgi:hypothetical protein
MGNAFSYEKFGQDRWSDVVNECNVHSSTFWSTNRKDFVKQRDMHVWAFGFTPQLSHSGQDLDEESQRQRAYILDWCKAYVAAVVKVSTDEEWAVPTALREQFATFKKVVDEASSASVEDDTD